MLANRVGKSSYEIPDNFFRNFYHFIDFFFIFIQIINFTFSFCLLFRFGILQKYRYQTTYIECAVLSLKVLKNCEEAVKDFARNSSTNHDSEKQEVNAF